MLARTAKTSHDPSMRTLLFLAALLVAPAVHAETLEDLHWLKGCWRTTGDGPVITEVWSAPPMPAMIGYSYTTAEGETQGWEAMLIEMIDGAPTFVGMPRGATGVRFHLREGAGVNEAIFDDAEHDFPQTVRYRRDGNRLTAVVALLDGSEAVTFEYRRIRCDGALRP